MLSSLLIAARLTALWLGLLVLVGMVTSSSTLLRIDSSGSGSSSNNNNNNNNSYNNNGLLMDPHKHVIPETKKKVTRYHSGNNYKSDKAHLLPAQPPLWTFVVEPSQPSPSRDSRDHEEQHVQQQQQPQVSLSCTTLHVYLNQDDIKANQFLENNGIPGPGVRFGGSIPARTGTSATIHTTTTTTTSSSSNAEDEEQAEQQQQQDLTSTTYNYLLTFLSSTDCLATGAYTFAPAQPTQPTHLPDQITFTATCHALPYFTITGGQGRYAGASGHVKYQIPTDNGFRHEVHVCMVVGTDEQQQQQL